MDKQALWRPSLNEYVGLRQWVSLSGFLKDKVSHQRRIILDQEEKSSDLETVKRKGNKWLLERRHWKMHATMVCPTQNDHKWSSEGSKKWDDQVCDNIIFL